MTEQTAISFDNVGLRFGSFTVHRDITFHVNCGEVVTLMGPSGTGKTMLLKMIIGLISPSSGSVIVQGQDLTTLKEKDIRKVRQNIGMLFQGAALFDSLSVYENVAYSLRERNEFNEEQIKEIVMDKLEIVGLPDIANKTPQALSGGQKKRVGLARALASSPQLMLFDEPTTGLDPTATRLINELIIKLRDDFNITSVVVTHDMSSAKAISDRWVLLNEGHVVANGTVRELTEQNSKRYNESVLDFVEGHWKEQ